MTQFLPRRGVATLVAACAAVAVNLVGAGTATAHGGCTDTAQIPALQLPSSVAGGNTFECDSAHASMKSCVHLQWRPATSSSWTHVGNQVCDTSSSSAYEYVSTSVPCTSGYWRSHGTGQAKNSSGDIAHSATHYSAERLITCA